MLSIVVFACYLAGAIWLGSSLAHADTHAARGRRTAGLVLAAIGLALHALLLWRDVFASTRVAFTAAESAALIGWPIAVVSILLSVGKPRFAVISSILLVLAGISATTTLLGASGYALERHSWEIAAHIVLSTLSYALLTIAVALSIAAALLDRRLRTRRPLGWLRLLPSLQALEAGTFHALATGFFVLTLALFSGFIFVDDLFAQHLIHKTVLSCLAWVVFAVLLFGRWRFGWRGQTATSWTVSGFALLGLAYFGSKIVLETILGRHWG